MIRSILLVLAAGAVACAAVPPEMVGAWGYTESCALQYRNRATGAFARPSGTTESLHIFPDGYFQEEALIQQSMYACSSMVFLTFTGHVFVGWSIHPFSAGKWPRIEQGHLQRALELREGSCEGNLVVRCMGRAGRAITTGFERQLEISL